MAETTQQRNSTQCPAGINVPLRKYSGKRKGLLNFDVTSLRVFGGIYGNAGLLSLLKQPKEKRTHFENGKTGLNAKE